ncbi:MAG: (2Fe-2S) ferredoxin domain-containing protein [Phormidesmis sp.]
MSATRFCLIGRFTAFLPGEKSPYQMISLEAVQAEDHLNSRLVPEPIAHQVLLSKDLRRMMYRYLAPQDWVRVVGEQTLNRRNGQMEWKAAEISKLSAFQVDRLKQEMVSHTKINASGAGLAARVLICQESSCRQRGSLAVKEAMAHALTETEGLSKVVIQATGCLKRCKLGPNVVTVPGGSYSRMTVEAGRSLIRKLLDSEPKSLN